MKNESAKTSLLEMSQNVLEENRIMVKQKICKKKTNTLTIIAINFFQEQLKRFIRKINFHRQNVIYYQKLALRINPEKSFNKNFNSEPSKTSVLYSVQKQSTKKLKKD